MTHSPLLRHDETLFRDPEVFEFTFVPEHLHHRDAQVQELAWLIRPALRGGSALSAVLRGPPGTGKTTTVRRIFRDVTAETRRIVPAYVNCRHERTPLAVYRSIYKAITGHVTLGPWRRGPGRRSRPLQHYSRFTAKFRHRMRRSNGRGGRRI